LRWELAVEADAPACGGLCVFSLDLPRDQCDALASLLNAAERDRAARFHTRLLADRFIVAHARLRQLLSEVVDVPPPAIEFSYGPHGKPHLAGAAASTDMRFNLSHSDSVGLVGWAHGRDIGVDIERWRGMRDEAAIVLRYFSAAEVEAYNALPAARRSEAFFNGWTRKEAYVKAVGRGIALALDSFDVTLGDAADARLLRSSVQPGDTRHWSLAAPQGPQGVSLAVVLEADHIRTHVASERSG